MVVEAPAPAELRLVSVFARIQPYRIPFEVFEPALFHLLKCVVKKVFAFLKVSDPLQAKGTIQSRKKCLQPVGNQNLNCVFLRPFFF